MAIRRISGRITNKDGQSLGDAKVAADGNGDYRLYVNDLNSGAGSGTGVPASSTKMRYDDMNVSNGGIARDSSYVANTWTDVYSYSGSGLLYSFLVTNQSIDKFFYRLVVDSEEIFGSSGISGADLLGAALYNIVSIEDTFAHGIQIENKPLHWQGPLGYPLKYDTNVTIKVKSTDSGKKFHAGLVVLSKET